MQDLSRNLAGIKSYIKNVASVEIGYFLVLFQFSSLTDRNTQYSWQEMGRVHILLLNRVVRSPYISVDSENKHSITTVRIYSNKEQLSNMPSYYLLITI